MTYTRNDPTVPTIREVAIQSVDAANHSAQGITRFAATNVTNINNPLNKVFIDTSYYVGATQVQPAVGEQWNIQKVNGQWRLHSRISFNDPNQQVEPTQGQHIVGGGNGPIELQGTQINANAPLATQAVTTSNRPDANSVPPGTQIYDSTLGQPIWSNGTNWHNAAGSTV